MYQEARISTVINQIAITVLFVSYCEAYANTPKVNNMPIIRAKTEASMLFLNLFDKA